MQSAYSAPPMWHGTAQAAQKSADEIKRELAAQHGITLNPPPTVPPTMGSDEAGNGKCSADAEMSDAPSSIPEAQQRNGIHPFNARRAAQVCLTRLLDLHVMLPGPLPVSAVPKSPV